MGNKNIKPGNATPKSGHYGVVGPRGGTTNKEVTTVKGNTMPPTTKPGQSYIVVDPTKNKFGR